MGVEFNENRPINYGYPPKRGGLANLIIKMGLAKDEAGVQKVLMITAIIFFLISFYFFFIT